MDRTKALDTLVTAARYVEGVKDYRDQLGAIRFVELAADQARRAIVAEARTAGTTWQEIGDALGVTRQAAEARFGDRSKPRATQFRHEGYTGPAPTNFGGLNAPQHGE